MFPTRHDLPKAARLARDAMLTLRDLPSFRLSRVLQVSSWRRSFELGLGVSFWDSAAGGATLRELRTTASSRSLATCCVHMLRISFET